VTADVDDELELETVDTEVDLEDSPELETADTDPDLEQAADEDPQASAPDDDSELPGDDSADTDDDRRGRYQKRIDELVAARNTQSERGDRLEQELKELRQQLEQLKPKEPEVSEPIRPRLENFESDEEYEAALDTYFDERVEFKLAKKAQEDQAKREAKEAEQTQRQQQEKAVARIAWLQEVDAAHPGIGKRVQDLPALSEAAADVLTGMEVEHSVKVVEELEANPRLAIQIAQLDPADQESVLMEIGTGQPATSRSVKKITAAPQPKKPTGPTRRVPSKDPSKAKTLAEYAAARGLG